MDNYDQINLSEDLPKSAEITPEELEIIRRWHHVARYNNIYAQDAYIHEDEV